MAFRVFAKNLNLAPKPAPNDIASCFTSFKILKFLCKDKCPVF